MAELRTLQVRLCELLAEGPRTVTEAADILIPDMRDREEAEYVIRRTIDRARIVGEVKIVRVARNTFQIHNKPRKFGVVQGGRRDG